MVRISRGSLAFLMASLLVACSDGGSGPTGGGTGGTITATVDGTSFAPRSTEVSASYAGGALAFAASQTTGSTTRTININLVGVTAPGTFTLSPTTPGSIALLTVTTGLTPSTWTTALSPGSGTVQVTTLTANRATGTFSFTGQFSPTTSATGQKTVTAGQFDVSF
ncbi:MAG: hypothetical protein KC544_02250 [Gemmatimonadetes bacterium]|nr:hypothetical protein [Gemmatimonadota bacterium]MCB9505082.1 hypothetical protein [Gemmatimonadales bacterium]MCA9761932.1 hypothetical protein [Gemmatimonadota bacterium]MCA9767605.1 hypothetical protein [Gemmatimonadota bacterium]MCB9517785.1 hypothetical protein [Gemmatimonadales bacterium]